MTVEFNPFFNYILENEKRNPFFSERTLSSQACEASDKRFLDSEDYKKEWSLVSVSNLKEWIRFRKLSTQELCNKSAIDLLERKGIFIIDKLYHELLKIIMNNHSIINYSTVDRLKYCTLKLKKIEIYLKSNVAEELLLRAFFQTIISENKNEVNSLLDQLVGKIKAPNLIDNGLDKIKSVANTHFGKIAFFLSVNYVAGKPALINLFQNKIAPMITSFIDKNLSTKIVPLCVKMYNRRISLLVTSVSLPTAILFLSSIGSIATCYSKKIYLNRTFSLLSNSLLKIEMFGKFFQGGRQFFILSVNKIFMSTFKMRDEIVYEERLQKAEDLFVAHVMQR